MGEFEVDRHSVVHPGVVEEVDRSGLSVDPSRLVSTTSRSVTFPATAQGMFPLVDCSNGWSDSDLMTLSSL